jgi:hypothetical protein
VFYISSCYKVLVQKPSLKYNQNGPLCNFVSLWFTLCEFYDSHYVNFIFIMCHYDSEFTSDLFQDLTFELVMGYFCMLGLILSFLFIPGIILIVVFVRLSYQNPKPPSKTNQEREPLRISLWGYCLHMSPTLPIWTRPW